MQVNLPPRKTMKCGTRKGVVVVVPAVTEDGDCQKEVVAAVVVAAIGPGSKQMTEGVYAPDGVMAECNPNQAALEESVERTTPAANQPTTERGRNRQSQKNPEKVKAIQLHQHAIFDQLRDIKHPIVDLRSE